MARSHGVGKYITKFEYVCIMLARISGQSGTTLTGILMCALFCKERIEIPNKPKVKVSKALFSLLKFNNCRVYYVMQWVNAFAWLGKRTT